jgi:hypothetical protein
VTERRPTKVSSASRRLAAPHRVFSLGDPIGSKRAEKHVRIGGSIRRKRARAPRAGAALRIVAAIALVIACQ